MVVYISRKRGYWIKVALYFFLVSLLLLFLFLHAFKVVDMETGTFTRFLISLLFVLLLLPFIPRIKIFDLVDVKRDTKMFGIKRK
ncbi:MAG: hypothetical protein GY861_08925 [bacterium]|nr:hypothetical protein [bacterium]